MDDSAMDSVSQIADFLQSSSEVTFSGTSQTDIYLFIEETLCRLRYFKLRRCERTIIKRYLEQMTGYSRSQMTRLVKKQKSRGTIKVKTGKRGAPFHKKYGAEDIALLAETDLAHSRLSGPATTKIFMREYEVFHDERFVRLRDISVSHVYNLRQTMQYTSKTKFFSKTRPTATMIGERRKPNPEGKPGYLRVDTVHQGDDLLLKEKGVYHINTVDDVLQWEVIGAVKTICDHDLVPLLESLIDQYPFRILGFHSDNGSEYINRQVAAMLNRLLIKQTKSRARRCNDNALGESKNGSVIRKHMGYAHIKKDHASAINTFYKEHFNSYLNFHRPSGYATIITDAKGKEKKIYETYEIPYKRLLSLPSPEQYLKPDMTLEHLSAEAMRQSDNQAAREMQKAKHLLFTSFRVS